MLRVNEVWPIRARVTHGRRGPREADRRARPDPRSVSRILGLHREGDLPVDNALLRDRHEMTLPGHAGSLQRWVPLRRECSSALQTDLGDVDDPAQVLQGAHCVKDVAAMPGARCAEFLTI